MITGVGVDIVEIERVARIVKQYGERFLGRVFTPSELKEAEGRRERLAGRFAAKEAVLKVLQTGLAEGITWHEVRTFSGERGEPRVELSGRAEELAKERGIRTVHLSISHDRDRAVAFAVGEG